jgi:hypothetical protein
VLYLYICVLQHKWIHFYQTASQLTSPILIVASASLRLLYLFLYSEHINHIRFLVSFPCPFPSVCGLPLVWPVSYIIAAFFWCIICI